MVEVKVFADGNEVKNILKASQDDSRPDHLDEEELNQVCVQLGSIRVDCFAARSLIPQEKRKIPDPAFGGNFCPVNTKLDESILFTSDLPISFDKRAKWILCRRNRNNTKNPIGYMEAIRRSCNPLCLDYWLARVLAR